nr:hypothetical protein [Arabidopsis thaliana]
MGNALTFLYGKCCKPTTTDDSLGPHGVSAATVGVSALAHDLFNFEITSQVPEGLGRYVQSSRKAQANWYRKILEAWKQAKPPPQTAEEASRLVTDILKRNQKADVEGLLSFYGLPLSHTLVEVTVEAPVSLPEGILFEFQTLPVDPKAVADGDTITVYVSTSEPVVSSSLFGDGKGNRGIDAPESQMPFGKEAQEGLLKIVGRKSLKVLVYGEDQYGRCVGDLYCNGIFVQEAMLKKGLAWHYLAYDKRPVLAKARLWEKEARQKRIGLWASSNPEKPWDWRKNNRRE